MAAPTDMTVVTTRGQASIPATLREEMAIKKGQRLLWERTGERELRVVLVEASPPLGAQAMRGFARRFRDAPRTTEDWLAELRDGENDSESES